MEKKYDHTDTYLPSLPPLKKKKRKQKQKKT